MDKFDRLTELLRSYERVAVAYSGGVDSSFLMKVAHSVLGGERVLGIYVLSDLNPYREGREARYLAADQGWQITELKVDIWEKEPIFSNSPQRCYFCKKNLMEKIKEEAMEKGFCKVLDGTNASDLGERRPGLQALKELGILSPLAEVGFTKEEVRRYSKEKYDLPTWNKPSMACLASRIPYGEALTPENLDIVAKGEAFLSEKGFLENRLRLHGKVARVEIHPEEFSKFLELREEIGAYFSELGLIYTTLDICGFRSGSGDLVL